MGFPIELVSTAPDQTINPDVDKEMSNHSFQRTVTHSGLGPLNSKR